MGLIKINSLERYINLVLAFLCLPLPLILGLWALEHEVWPALIIIGEIILIAGLYYIAASFRHRILSAFNRALLQLDAIAQADYNQHAKPTFSRGKVAEFHQLLNSLSTRLQAQKSRYDQHVFLVYQLIEQLETPVLVFNKKQQLSFGNQAFHYLFGQPWQMFRHASPELLGLNKTDAGWHFKEANKNQAWQIRHSAFIDAGETHQLLVFINIKSALRESQLKAWQQIIRVLGHEIRNSLTPVSSLAENLLEKTTQDKDQQALQVIIDRSQQLQDFVDRYSSLTKNLPLNCQWILIEETISRITSLFGALAFNTTISCKRIWADPAFLEQVLINLIKNAQEAEANQISIDISQNNHQSLIQIRDNGHGFANLENVFVPLYTTKPQGQGIGLSFCQNIIEQHGGSIEISNNKDRGVTVMIKLPFPKTL